MRRGGFRDFKAGDIRRMKSIACLLGLDAVKAEGDKKSYAARMMRVRLHRLGEKIKRAENAWIDNIAKEAE